MISARWHFTIKLRNNSWCHAFHLLKFPFCCQVQVFIECIRKIDEHWTFIFQYENIPWMISMLLSSISISCWSIVFGQNPLREKSRWTGVHFPFINYRLQTLRDLIKMRINIHHKTTNAISWCKGTAHFDASFLRIKSYHDR